ncbi:MAG: putative DNA binding domain-containing protein [Thermomicrobiales bacterium]|nr:putative DNA binding domain-containing protein [Thermomicrobiales bacterium]
MVGRHAALSDLMTPRRHSTERRCSIPPVSRRRTSAPNPTLPKPAKQAGGASSRGADGTALGPDAITHAPDRTWRRIDLHVHTPASVDYQQQGIGILDILKRAEERGLDAIALTDHNSVRGYADLWREIEDLELLEYLGRLQPDEAERLAEFRRRLARILVLPGFEFTAQFGFHILAIFPEGTSVRLMEHLLLLLGVPEDRFGSGEVGATTDVLRAYEILADHGALVIGAHVNSAHGIAMQGLRFGGQTKIAYTQDPNLHAMEVTDLLPASNRRSTARFFSGIKSEYPRRMHCIQGSDAHRLEQDPARASNLGIGDRPTEVLLPEMSFRALKELLTSDRFDDTRPFTPPPSDPIKAARLEGNTALQAFHESAATKRNQSAILRDVVGFANAGGGRIYLGLSAAEKRPIPGVDGAAAIIEELQAALAEQVTPAVDVDFEEALTDGKPIVILTVAEGPHKPHAIAPAGIYIRRDAESAQATRDEIVHMITGAAVRAAAALPAPAQPATSNGRSKPKESERVEPARPAKEPAPAKSERVASRAPAVEVEPTEHVASANGKSAAADAVAAPEPAEGLEITEEAVSPDPIAPTTGIEVLSAFEQDGVRYYTLRDLRYHKLIHNVTKSTDRKLWRSAIGQREKGELDESQVRWDGDYGLWRSYRQRSGERRYDLVYRGDGDDRIFYGVSEAGMDGRWKDLLASAKATA